MNWSEMSASWYEMRALVQSHWPRLDYEMLREIKGDRAKLGCALQRQYGFSAPDAETAICEFEEDVRRPGAVK
jgi:hypothetical protein